MSKHAKGKKIQCALCGRALTQITQKHLDSKHPGWTVEQYRDTYGYTTAKQVNEALAKQDAPDAQKVTQMVLQQLENDPDLMREITQRVGEGIFTGKLKGKAIGSALAVMFRRLKGYEAAAENIERVNEELFKDSRVKWGGDAGAPTPTDTLVRMAYAAQGYMRDGEDALLKILQMVVQDNAALPNFAQQLNLNVFSGAHEKVAIPSGLDAQKREAARLLITAIKNKPNIEEIVAKARSDRDTELTKGEIEDAEIVEK